MIELLTIILISIFVVLEDKPNNHPNPGISSNEREETAFKPVSKR